MEESTKSILAANLASIYQRIDAACQRSGRDPATVNLVAVTKYVDADIVDALVAAIETSGHRAIIGENRLQVAEPKFAAMQSKPEKHFIGPLQGKKVRDVLGLFTTLHSLDRMSLAERIQSRAESMGIERVPSFVQANVSGELSKGGFEPTQLFSALREIEASMPNIELVGLMTMAPASDNPEDARQYFTRLATLGRNARDEGFVSNEFAGLSMGMSSDFEVAIEEGATHVRVGSLLYAGLETKAKA